MIGSHNQKFYDITCVLTWVRTRNELAYTIFFLFKHDETFDPYKSLFPNLFEENSLHIYLIN